MLEIVSFVLGPVSTNSYLVGDVETGEAAVIDPAWSDPSVKQEADRRGWHIRQVWITHAHFDHFGGVAELASQVKPSPLIALHPADLPLWQAGGGAAIFGLRIPQPPNPTLELSHAQILPLGKSQIEVRFVPGHSPGHVVFYSAADGVVFCGDTVFWGSIGRTDLPGGDQELLISGIHEQILSLPDETRLLSGHGDETFVGQEKRWNPFLELG
jgi:glyoxylase-like metal-dependent hydrolase (beta-lactamase superfamily II)